MLGNHPFEDGRIGWRAVNGGDAKIADDGDELLRSADAERDDRRAGRFEHRMIGIAAHPHLIVQAMHDAMAGPEARKAAWRARRPSAQIMASCAESAMFMALPVEPEVRWTRETFSGADAR